MIRRWLARLFVSVFTKADSEPKHEDPFDEVLMLALRSEPHAPGRHRARREPMTPEDIQRIRQEWQF